MSTIKYKIEVHERGKCYKWYIKAKKEKGKIIGYCSQCKEVLEEY